ncbi:hypothetical protein L2E82_19410 [Cichorium intybus]|uniref:Uncharacterized protein n=1 Tax=Cichorium intybus TaxID=13427 RepID=A0ACB9FD73_CICIN|nr:hypothetical protein L2E82_19410 [Cichorium intybus]
MQRHYLRIQLNFPLIAEEIHDLGEQGNCLNLYSHVDPDSRVRLYTVREYPVDCRWVSRIVVQNQQQLSKEKKPCKSLGQNPHHHHHQAKKSTIQVQIKELDFRLHAITGD